MTMTWMDLALRRVRKTTGTFPYPHQAAVFLDNPVRRWFTDPAEVIDALGLSGSERVLELGPGPGFYSVEIAARVPEGGLDLFDVQQEMLDKSRHKLERAGHRDVGYRAGAADAEFPYSDNTFDVAFLAAVIGEVPDQVACLRSLARVVGPGGFLVFHEAFPDPDRLTVAELRELAEPAGFVFVESMGDRWHDLVRFQKPAR
jgi:ubiquinone/menaquinone biosynthesis C-methylase UbiE